MNMDDFGSEKNNNKKLFNKKEKDMGVGTD